MVPESWVHRCGGRTKKTTPTKMYTKPVNKQGEETKHFVPTDFIIKFNDIIDFLNWKNNSFGFSSSAASGARTAERTQDHRRDTCSGFNELAIQFKINNFNPSREFLYQ